MGKLTYGMMMSLDGFVADPSGHFDEEALRFVNNETRKNGTKIYGRRMYEAMVYWEAYEGQKDRSEYADEFARIGADQIAPESSHRPALTPPQDVLRLAFGQRTADQRRGRRWYFP
jgi:hypothetical protein